MMLEELRALLSHVPDENATKADYVAAIEQDNCLAKRSGRTRTLTLRHLSSLYGLDPQIATFRALRYFWKRDPAGQPLLACLSAYARDPIFRMSGPHILPMDEGRTVARADLELFIDAQEPGRFSKATLKSTAQNIASSWAQAGHVKGVVKKTRSRAHTTPGATAYALLLSYLKGGRGESLFTSDYVRVLDCSRETAVSLAGEASQRGWLTMKRVGTVIEILFPSLLTDQEKEWLRE